MKIAELEENFNAFIDLSRAIDDLLKSNAYSEAFDACRQSLSKLVPFLKFRKRKKIEPEFPELRCVEVVCEYAPAFFEKNLIDDFYQHFKSNRMLSKNYPELVTELDACRDLVSVAKQAWDKIAEQPGAHSEEVTADIIHDEAAESMLSIWSDANIVCARSAQQDRYRFVTRIKETMIAVCFHCGVKGRAAKMKLLKPNKCPKCKSNDYFHMIAADGN